MEKARFSLNKITAIFLAVIFAFVAFLGIVPTNALAAANKNLLINGDFEQGLEKWDNGESAFVIDENIFHSGTKSLKTSGINPVSVIRYRYIDVKPNTDYVLSAYVKKTSETVSGWIDANLDEASDAPEYQAGSIRSSNDAASDWEYISLKFNTKEAEKINIRCIGEGINETSSAWFDDLTLMEADPADIPVTGENLVKNGSFEEADTVKEDWNISDSEGGVVINSEEAASGDAYYKTAQGVNTAVLRNKNITVEPNTYYILRGYVKYNDVGVTAYVDVNEHADSDDPKYQTEVISMPMDRPNEWIRFYKVFQVGDVSKINIRCVADNMKSVNGEVCFDDIELIKTQSQFISDPTNEVLNGSFENSLADWSPEGGAFVLDDTYAADGSYSLKTTGKAGVSVARQGNVEIEPGGMYIVSGYIRRSNASVSAWFDLNAHETSDATNYLFQTLGCTSASVGDWEYIAVRVRMPEVEKINVRCVATGVTNENLAWFDNLRIEKTDDNLNEFPVESELVSPKEYTISNSANSAKFSVENNKLYISDVMMKGGNNWIPKPVELTLIDKISGNDVEWEFVDMTKSESAVNGEKLTFNFKSKDGKFQYIYNAEALPGTGPIEISSRIICESEPVEYNYIDVFTNKLLFTADGEATITRFNRSRMYSAGDQEFAQGVLKTTAAPNIEVTTSVENGCNTMAGVLPFQMIDVDGDHGLYYGYMWSFGKIINSTQEDPNKIALTTYLSDGLSTKITRKANEAFEVPGFFIGAYEGDIDEGSNQMKRWFWDYKMTESLRENENEPLVELHVSANSEQEWLDFFEANDVANWGVGLVKQDYWWTVPNSPPEDNSFDAYKEQQWLPDEGKWPNDMTLGHIAHENGVKLSLYMCDTYQGVDIGTDEGREKQLEALRYRIDNWDIDYWRSDFEVEGSYDYAKHEGLMYILDTLIDEYEGFRYEHCSGGGSLKDFTTLQRMTFMTTEDTGYAFNHRKAAYANTYMINPVQLKVDLSVDWNIPEDYAEGTEYGTTREWCEYYYRTGMMGAMMVCGSTRLLNDLEKEVAKEHYALYNERQREILRRCNTYHILPMPDGTDWDGMMYYNNDVEKGSVLLFRENGAGEDSKVIKLKGLDKNAYYDLEFQDETKLNCTMKGSDLMNEGVLVTGMTDRFDSEIIWITKSSQAETVDIPVEVIFEDEEDNDGLRPEEVEISLKADGKVTEEKLTLNIENKYSAVFEGLEAKIDGKAIDYTVEAPSINGYMAEVAGSAAEGFKVTYTHEIMTTEREVRIEWEDENDKAGKRPKEVPVYFFEGEENIQEENLIGEVKLNAQNGWKGSIELRDFKEGEIAIYTYAMEEISGYEAKGETDEDGNVVIKLTLKEGEPEKPEEPKDDPKEDPKDEPEKPNEDAPKTGEESGLMIWMLALLSAAVTAMAAARRVRKRSGR